MAKPGPKPQDESVKREIVNQRFNLVKSLMEQGLPKYIACKKSGVDRSWLHKNITSEQNKILDEIYFSFSQGSRATKHRVECAKKNLSNKQNEKTRS